MGTRQWAHTVFILYGFLFECVLLTGLLMASPFPGQGSAIRPYPGHASRAGGTRKNEVNPGHCVSVKDSCSNGLSKNWISRLATRNMSCHFWETLCYGRILWRVVVCTYTFLLCLEVHGFRESKLNQQLPLFGSLLMADQCRMIFVQNSLHTVACWGFIDLGLLRREVLSL